MYSTSIQQQGRSSLYSKIKYLQSARIRLRQLDGKTFDAFVEHPKGDPENPLSDEDLEYKFRELCKYCGMESQAQKFIDWTSALDSTENFSFPDLGEFY